VLPDRTLLDALAVDELAGAQIHISWKNDQRRFTLERRIGRGATAVAWLAKDVLDKSYAVKFVLQSEYGNHSLDVEARRTAALPDERFSRIEYFGTFDVVGAATACSDFYAIVVQWIEGMTLEAYLKQPSTVIDGHTFCSLARDLCHALQALKLAGLIHNDLHANNLIIRPRPDILTNRITLDLVVIDTGQLKTEERRLELIEARQQWVVALQSLPTTTDEISQRLASCNRQIDFFSRSDQLWVVRHLCTLLNVMRRTAPQDPATMRFVRSMPGLLRKMADNDPSRRISDPQLMVQEIEREWQQAIPGRGAVMTTPFDLPSAELIRSDRHLMDLFSEEYPRLDACRSYAPVYLYGPRGCGKSTILRSLSLKALLACANPPEEFSKTSFFGVYLSSSQELRSRFWLMKDADFDVLEAHVVRYFNLLLLEALIETLDHVLAYQRSNPQGIAFNLTPGIVEQCTAEVRRIAELSEAWHPYLGTSDFTVLRHDLRRERDHLWLRILDRAEARQRPNAQLVFDVCRRLEDIWPMLSERRVVFLIDDYSNQRIPVALQKRLNQAITFSKQGSPIFKVTSEYDGVDLEGVQEGREVSEVNVGYEYISLQDSQRHRFLYNVLQRRFAFMRRADETLPEYNLLEVLPFSNLEPTIPMARKIKECHDKPRRFRYHGLDTISDLCSGDIAMGIDLVRRIFEHASVDWRLPKRISDATQDDAIRDYTKQEFEYIRYQSRSGRMKYEIADKLCWLSKECLVTKEGKKDGKVVPLIKNHIDIREKALKTLEARYPLQMELLSDLVRRGILFPIQPSRAREGRDATRRYMIRRILLPRHGSALGRHYPIRIDDCQRLLTLLSDPEEFVKSELAKTGKNEPEPSESVASESENVEEKKVQGSFPWAVEDGGDA
jgi:serine/threonine protein kinase